MYSQALLSETLIADHTFLMASRFGGIFSPRTPAMVAAFLSSTAVGSMTALGYAHTAAGVPAAVCIGSAAAIVFGQLHAVRMLIEYLRDRDLVPVELRTAYSRVSSLSYAISNGVVPNFDEVFACLDAHDGSTIAGYSLILQGMKLLGELDSYTVRVLGDCRKLWPFKGYPPLDRQWAEMVAAEWPKEGSSSATEVERSEKLIELFRTLHSVRALEGLKTRFERLDGIRKVIDASYEELQGERARHEKS
jgi:hypothetical protein